MALAFAHDTNPCTAYRKFKIGSAGVSGESKQILSAIRLALPEQSDSVGLAERCLLVNQIDDLIEQYSSEGWDGYEAQSLDSDAAKQAQYFIRLLPRGVILPEALPDPTGEIMLEWDLPQTGHLILTFDGVSIAYASRFNDGTEQRGIDPFLDDVPRSLAELLNVYFRHE